MALPEDIKQVCLWIVRGQSRRRQLKNKSRKEAALEKIVEAALDNVGVDIQSAELRCKLRSAMLLNIESGREWPYERLGIDFVSRRDFYRRRDNLLMEIAQKLALCSQRKR